MDEELYLVKAKEYKVQDGDTIKSLADNAGITWQQLAKFNWGTDKPAEINQMLRNRLGCSKTTKDGRNYVFTSDDDPGILYIPEDAPDKKLTLNQTTSISAGRPKIYGGIMLQTSDMFGHKLGNVSLTLQSQEGWPDVSITTDAGGVGKKDKVPFGNYKVLVDGDKPTYFLSNTLAETYNPDLPDAKFGKYTEAILHTDFYKTAITRIIIIKGNEKDNLTQQNVLGRNTRIPTFEFNTQDKDGKQTVERITIVDNMALAASWDDSANFNTDKLVKDVLPSWLKDNYPETTTKGYYVYLINRATPFMYMYDKNGDKIATYTMGGTIKLTGAVGAYAPIEIDKKQPYLDMTSQSFTMQTNLAAKDGEVTLVPLADVVQPSDKDKFISDAAKYGDEMGIVYYLCPIGQLMALALMGGTGRLEDYGSNENTRASVHKRNMAVVTSIRNAYNYYIKEVFIPELEKANSEDEIRALGPPKNYFQIPIPVGANDQELTDLFDAMKADELAPWKALSDKLDEIWKRHSQGNFFLRFKLKYAKSAAKVKAYDPLNQREDIKKLGSGVKAEVSVETNLDVEVREHGMQVLTKSKETVTLTFKDDVPATGKTSNGFPVEASIKVNPEDVNDSYISLRIAMFQIELPYGPNASKMKMQVKDIVPGVGAESSWDYKNAEMYTGVNFTLKDLMKKVTSSESFKNWVGKNYGTTDVGAARKANTGLNSALSLLESLEVGVGLGFTGMREETALAVLSSGHGFYDRRSFDDLCDALWNVLHLWEQTDLVKLGWSMGTWDNKYYKDFESKLPSSLNKQRNELSDDEKVAIVDLGFYGYEDYGKIVKAKIKHSAK